MLVLNWTIVKSADEAVNEAFMAVELPLHNFRYVQDFLLHYFYFLSYVRGHLTLAKTAAIANNRLWNLEPKSFAYEFP